jgi:hypothetical protein
MAAVAEILSPGESSPVDTTPDDGLLDVAALVRMFEESEDASLDARKDAERDRDYVDNKQLTADEIATLEKRGQPPQIDNRIKTKVDYLVGLEKQQRIDPRALPRTPMHEEEAGAATEALRYVADTENYDSKRSGVWRNLLVEGAGGIEVAVEPGYNGEPYICLRRVAWDRSFWDPHSSEADFSDAGYLGIVIWKNYDDALREYPDGKEALDTTMRSAPSDTYDDKPKFNHWADRKRKRVRVCQIWIRKQSPRGDEWHFAEFTKGGILKAGPSPYVTDKGESDCGLFFQSAYVDRDNNRYGLVREMITIQDGINKRKSKSLHLLNTHQTTYEEGAVEDIEAFRREKARPDGTMKVAPGALQQGRIISEVRVDHAQAHMLLLQDDKNSIDLKGPNATAMGDKAQGSSAASGRAILASQQGGMVSLGDLLDNLRHLDKRVFRAIWHRIRQFWTDQKWIRVTDDEQNVKWVGMNVDPMQVQMAAQQDPRMAQKIAGMVTNVAELDCDIIIDEVPDVILSQEQFNQLVELKKYDVNNELPFRALVAASSVKDKQKMFQEMDKRAQEQAQSPGAQLQVAGAQAEVEDTQAAAGLKKAQTIKALADANAAQMPDMGGMQPQPAEVPVEVQTIETMARAGDLAAAAELKRVQAGKAQMETQLMPAKMRMEARNAEMDRMHAAHNAEADRAMQAKAMKARPRAGQQRG